MIILVSLCRIPFDCSIFSQTTKDATVIILLMMIIRIPMRKLIHFNLYERAFFYLYKSYVSLYVVKNYMRFSISAHACSIPIPFSEEKTMSGSAGSISNVCFTIFLCLSHLPFGILSAFVAIMIAGML